MSFILVELFEPSLLLEVNDKRWLPCSGLSWKLLVTSEFRFRRLLPVAEVDKFSGECILRLESSLVSLLNCLFHSILIAKLRRRHLTREVDTHIRVALDLPSVVAVLD